MDEQDILTDITATFYTLDIPYTLSNGIALELQDDEQATVIRLCVKEKKDQQVGIISNKNGSSCPSEFNCCIHNKQFSVSQRCSSRQLLLKLAFLGSHG